MRNIPKYGFCSQIPCPTNKIPGVFRHQMPTPDPYSYKPPALVHPKVTPGGGPEGSGQRRHDAPQETVGVLAGEEEVDEGQCQESVDGVAEQAAEDVFAETGKEQPHVLHLHDLAGHQEQDAHRGIPNYPRDRLPPLITCSPSIRYCAGHISAFLKVRKRPLHRGLTLGHLPCHLPLSPLEQGATGM